MAQGDIFVGDPLTGMGDFDSNSGSLTGVDLSNVFDGRFVVSGGFFRDTTDPGSSIGLGRQGGFTLQDVGNGRFSMSTQIDTSRVNHINNDMAWRSIMGSVDVLLHDGTVQTVDFGPQEVTRAGYQAIAYPRTDGSTGISFVRGIYNNNTEVQVAYGASYRLATPLETVQAAVMKKIFDDNRDVLDTIGEEEGITDENGNVDLSGVVRFVMSQIDISNISTFTQYLFE